jgi:alkylresorcinol/alkylpyrone synthase
VALALPPNVVDQDAALDALTALFPAQDAESIRGMVRRSGVERRHIVPTLDQVLGRMSFTERNRRYHEAAIDLASEACSRALAASGLAPDEIDVLIDVSCTGVSIPALDVSIAPRLGLRSDVRRVPITASGCAGGALGLCIAAAQAQAGQRALVVAVELCSLSLVREDLTRTNLVASVLFGDGAAAAVVAPHGPGPHIAAVGSHLIPDTRDVMGFDIGTHGLRIILQRELPAIVAEELPRVLVEFLSAHGCQAEEIDLHLVHPGGRRILEAYERSFNLGPDGLRHSRRALSSYGNLSSASILAVLQLAMQELGLGRERNGLLVGIGPGLSIEMALLRWEGTR